MNINFSMQGINSFKSGQEGGFQQGGNAMRGVGKQDSRLQNIQNQMEHLQERLHGLNENTELSMTEKMELRKEIREQMQELNKQFMERQIEIRKEEQEKRAEEMKEQTEKMTADNNRSEQSESTMDHATMQQLITGDSLVTQIETRQGVKMEISGQARTLAGEIRMDKGRGASTDKKEAALNKMEERLQNITEDTMSKISEVKENLASDEDTDSINSKEVEEKVRKNSEKTLDF